MTIIVMWGVLTLSYLFGCGREQATAPDTETPTAAAKRVSRPRISLTYSPRNPKPGETVTLTVRGLPRDAGYQWSGAWFAEGYGQYLPFQSRSRDQAVIRIPTHKVLVSNPMDGEPNRMRGMSRGTRMVWHGEAGQVLGS